MLSQLVYVSNRKATCTDIEIQKILDSCKKNNPSLDITGILLYSDKKFIQLVEGESKTLNQLYDKIKQDSRHENCMLISYGPIKSKAFPSWHMGSRSIAGSEVDFKTVISDDDKKIFSDLLAGKEEKNGERVLGLLKKFF
jgi:hypothetical protein